MMSPLGAGALTYLACSQSASAGKAPAGPQRRFAPLCSSLPVRVSKQQTSALSWHQVQTPAVAARRPQQAEEHRWAATRPHPRPGQRRSRSPASS